MNCLSSWKSNIISRKNVFKVRSSHDSVLPTLPSFFSAPNLINDYSKLLKFAFWPDLRVKNSEKKVACDKNQLFKRENSNFLKRLRFLLELTH